MIRGSPPEWGLPEKFDAWRDSQRDAVSRVLDSESRFTALVMPPGLGKTLAYIAAAHISGLRTCVITPSKGQQDQIMEEFAEVGAVDIRGKDNYRCSWNSDHTCGEGAAIGCQNRGTVKCPHSKAKFAASTAPIVVTNYPCWIYNNRYEGFGQKFDMIVLDEAHDMDEEVGRAKQIKLSFREINDILGMDVPKNPGDMLAWSAWAVRALPVCRRLGLEAAKRVVDGRKSGNLRQSWVKEYYHLRSLYRKVKEARAVTLGAWVSEGQEWGFTLDPVNVARYAEGVLFLGTPKVLLVSATMTRKSANMVGIPSGALKFIEYPSEFDPRNFRVMHIPTAQMDSRSTEAHYAAWLMRSDQIIKPRRDRNAIFHAGSYARTTFLVAHSDNSDIMLHNRRGELTSGVINQFKWSKKPHVLVSPSVTTGYDFPFEKCEYQIIGKVPFPDSRSEVVKARQQADPEYGMERAMRVMVQASTRGMRASDDRCEVFIIDDHVTWFVRKHGDLAPKWFWRFYQSRDSMGIPPPPERVRRGT
jgi:Rad3-related DNA helicase